MSISELAHKAESTGSAGVKHSDEKKIKSWSHDAAQICPYITCLSSDNMQ